MSDTPRITVSTVQALVADQFPKWSALPVTPVQNMGWDNRTFHLGEDKLVRLPSGPGYAAQPTKEWACLPHLAPHFPVAIPKVLGQGKPAFDYPYHWSILSYLDGAPPQDTGQTSTALAEDVSAFLKALHTTPPGPGPAPGQHNYHRGGDVRIYDQDIRHALAQIGTEVDTDRILRIWTKACHSHWAQPPVWVHGNMAQGNILTNDDRLCGVIDFGCCAVGDPACDLTIAWTYFQGAASTVFTKSMDLDPNTWMRARGWALWKASIELAKGNMATKDTIKAVLRSP